MANAQKRGFRFPWGGEPDADATRGSGDAGVDDGLDLAAEAGAGDGDGRASFEDRQGRRESATEAETMDDQAVDDAEDPMNDMNAAVAIDATEAEATSKNEDGAQPDAASASAPGWPAVDRRAADRPFASASAGAGPAAGGSAARRGNPLVAGLVKAMREAARVARDESVAGLRAEAEERSEAIRAESTVNAAELRKTADADVTAIREWSKAELARVREETEQRINARRTQLVTETEAEAEATEAMLARLADVVAQFERQNEAFFESLFAEEDPARLAGLAERMPQPPALDTFGAAGWSGDPVAAEPDEAAAESDAPAAEPDGLAADDRLDPDAAAAAEAEAIAGLDTQTHLLVAGLAGVAGIAAFKSELLGLPGVRAVSVATADGGEFQFSVTHDADADVRTALRDVAAFEIRVLSDDGATVSLVAQPVAA